MRLGSLLMRSVMSNCGSEIFDAALSMAAAGQMLVREARGVVATVVHGGCIVADGTVTRRGQEPRLAQVRC
jgi:pyrimidine deaminase RibD-like protein